MFKSKYILVANTRHKLGNSFATHNFPPTRGINFFYLGNGKDPA